MSQYTIYDKEGNPLETFEAKCDSDVALFAIKYAMRCGLDEWSLHRTGANYTKLRLVMDVNDRTVC